MNSKFIIIIFFCCNQLLNGMAPSSMPQRVLVWNLNHLSTNAGTKTLVTNALLNPGVFLQGRSWWASTKLLANAWSIAAKGEEIEKGSVATNQPPTYGKANIISKLLAYMSSYCPSEPFTAKDTYNFCNLAVEPQSDNNQLLLAHLIKMLRQNGHICIGICNQDLLEHQIYARKIAPLLHYSLNELFHKIIGIPYEGQTPVRNIQNFELAPAPYPSAPFVHTMLAEAKKVAPSRAVFLIDDPCNRAAVLSAEPNITFVPFTSFEDVQHYFGITQ